jgi:shikimate kinase
MPMSLGREIAPLICLIGYRGCGKTTLAPLLSERIGWPWIDTDIELERRAGRSIKEIFEKAGEPTFRDLETATILNLTSVERRILAFGGGAILRPQNVEAIRRGLVFWLQADPQTIWKRMTADPLTAQRRPNLTGGGIGEIEQLLAARTSLYRECADHAIDTVLQTPDQIVDQIVCLVVSHFPDLTQDLYDQR